MQYATCYKYNGPTGTFTFDFWPEESLDECKRVVNDWWQRKQWDDSRYGVMEPPEFERIVVHRPSSKVPWELYEASC